MIDVVMVYLDRLQYCSCVVFRLWYSGGHENVGEGNSRTS